MITFKQISKAFKEASILSYVPDEPHKGINAYAVIDDGSELNSENLTYRLIDTNSPFFFSRAWASTDFTEEITWEPPVACIVRESGVLKNPLSKKEKQGDEVIRFYVLDQYVDSVSNDGTAALRCKEDIYEDTKCLAFNLLRTVFESKTAEGHALRNTFSQSSDFSYNFISNFGQSNLYGVELTFKMRSYFCDCL